jgi:hypothetical protein
MKFIKKQNGGQCGGPYGQGTLHPGPFLAVAKVVVDVAVGLRIKGHVVEVRR